MAGKGLLSCCFPVGGRREASSDRQSLLARRSSQHSKHEGSQAASGGFDLRRIFSRADISAIPEHSEINQGAETNHPVQTPILSTAEAGPPPSPLPGPPPRELERLFSRGATKSSPVTLNRLFSRGAVPRTNSNLSAGWRAYRASTTDSANEDYGDIEKVDTMTDSASQSSPAQSMKKTVTNRGSRLFAVEQRPSESDESPAEDAEATRLIRQQSSAAQSFSSRKKFPELALAIQKLQQVSDHLVVATLQAETRDHEDHTFSGIYFNVKARTLIPYEFMEIQAISIRGRLGLISIYATDKSYEGKQSDPSKWIRHYGPSEVPPSNVLKEIVLDIPIRLSPGMTKGIYLHSETPGDKSIVYDNRRSAEHTFEDNIFRIYPGMAHTTHVPFAPSATWGGHAFRNGREFVGSMRYGIKPLMWTPEVHHHFPYSYRRAINTFIACHSKLARDQPLMSTLGSIPTAVVLRIINMMPVDWFPITFRPEDSDEENGPTPDPFQYGGHVGRIAAMRHMFDTARQETLTTLPREVAPTRMIDADAILNQDEDEDDEGDNEEDDDEDGDGPSKVVADANVPPSLSSG